MSRCKCGDPKRNENWQLDGCEELRELKAEVERLTAGIRKALDTPDARAYILEHTLKNGADNCCNGRCAVHGVAEAVRP